jgi:hypothetical protein
MRSRRNAHQVCELQPRRCGVERRHELVAAARSAAFGLCGTCFAASAFVLASSRLRCSPAAGKAVAQPGAQRRRGVERGGSHKLAVVYNVQLVDAFLFAQVAFSPAARRVRARRGHAVERLLQRAAAVQCADVAPHRSTPVLAGGAVRHRVPLLGQCVRQPRRARQRQRSQRAWEQRRLHFVRSSDIRYT